MSLSPFRGRYLPSRFLIFFESGADKMLSTATRRLRELVFSWNLCWFIAEPCFTLPVPVSLKRFLAPECVLFLGLMAPPFLALHGGLACKSLYFALAAGFATGLGAA